MKDFRYYPCDCECGNTGWENKPVSVSDKGIRRGDSCERERISEHLSELKVKNYFMWSYKNEDITEDLWWVREIWQSCGVNFPRGKTGSEMINWICLDKPTETTGRWVGSISKIFLQELQQNKDLVNPCNVDRISHFLTWKQ